LEPTAGLSALLATIANRAGDVVMGWQVSQLGMSVGPRRRPRSAFIGMA